MRQFSLAIPTRFCRTHKQRMWTQKCYLQALWWGKQLQGYFRVRESLYKKTVQWCWLYCVLDTVTVTARTWLLLDKYACLKHMALCCSELPCLQRLKGSFTHRRQVSLFPVTEEQEQKSCSVPYLLLSLAYTLLVWGRIDTQKGCTKHLA